MKWAVLGAGAVGCYYGGMLARAGHSVVLIGRPVHAEAMQASGLLLETRTFTERVAVQASTEPAAVAGADAVLLCVKSTDTASSVAAMAPWLRPGAVVLSLQNGVDNAERAQATLKTLGLPNEVLPTVVYVATEMAGPGHVKHHGRGELVMGPSAQPGLDAQLVAALAQASVPVTISDNVTGALWAKLIVNCAYNALSAITHLPYGQLVQGPGIWGVMQAVVQECEAVAKAVGVQPVGDAWTAVQAIAQTMQGQYSSTAQDLSRGKPTEIEFLNGYVVRQGAQHGVPVPMNQLLLALVQTMERRTAAA